jgi:adenylate cyclase
MLVARPEAEEAMGNHRDHGGLASGAALARRTRRRLDWAAGLSNGVGAIVVFVFLAFLVPRVGTPDEVDAALVRNAVALALYGVASGTFATWWGHRRFEPIANWLRAGRGPTEGERQATLRHSVDFVAVSAPVWGLGAVLFALLNLSESVALAVRVGSTILLGGITTCAVGYLVVERLMRPVTALALATGPPRRPAAPGVTARLALAWIAATGVPLLGVVTLVLYGLAGTELDERSLAGTAFLAAIALVVGLLATLIAARAVADPLAAMRRALEQVQHGDFEARVTVDDASEVGLLQSGFNQMAEGLGERERIREAFGTYVDREVAEHILREGTNLAGEEVEVTMMFIDVRDFTGFAERSSAPEVVASLNRLFGRVVPIVHAHEGHVDKFVGDGLLAVFGAPRRQDDHAEQALDAALEIERAVREEFAGELEIGIGLNSGTVVAGNVGGAGRLEFSVIGDAVNVAARVEATTRKTGDTVLLTEHTVRLLGRHAAAVERRPAVPLKGKHQAVSLYAPVRERAAAHPGL